MKTKINQKLKEIEQQEQIEILFAVESGSRAWGFASPDSDFDIRFVYKHSADWYLNLWEQKDTLEFMTDEDLDGSGWDLKKALKLMAKSNASFVEWVLSPVVYRADDVFLKELVEICQENFNPVSIFYHYHSMNKGFQEVLETPEVNLKGFFYFFRAALCANWVLKKKSIPPVEFRQLYSLINKKDQQLLDELIALKYETAEKGVAFIPKQLMELAKEIIEQNEKEKNNILASKVNHNALNQFFLKTIR